jgi:VanZ family protein
MYRIVSRAVAWSLLAAIAFATLSPVDLRPTFGFGPNLDRAVGFFALGMSLALAYPRHKARIATLVIAIAVALEAAQWLAPDRDPRVHDVVVKAFGGLLGVLAAHLLERLRRRMRLPEK